MTGSVTIPLADMAEDGSAFVVELDQFTGPLDLLLHLLREERIEIADIPIARIADQFLRAIHQLGLNQAADYLDMASRLVRLKAQLLLPRHSDEEGWEDPRAELVRRLLEY
ncbi:MAG TPA: segregation/condensation protein A, partial [Gemmatimonadales bacterium]|nr:segregation/condensation protein A [Gemmatimonadales bacterium]